MTRIITRYHGVWVFCVPARARNGPQPEGMVGKAMAGYSGTPLVRKLGIRTGMTVQLIDAPPDYFETLGELPEGVVLCRRARKNLDFLQGFVTRQSRLQQLLQRALRYLAPDGMLWVSWPKKASAMPTEVSETEVRRAGLNAGLVDVKICAVDDTWSGLKFVYRLKDR